MSLTSACILQQIALAPAHGRGPLLKVRIVIGAMQMLRHLPFVSVIPRLRHPSCAEPCRQHTEKHGSPITLPRPNAALLSLAESLRGMLLVRNVAVRHRPARLEGDLERWARAACWMRPARRTATCGLGATPRPRACGVPATSFPIWLPPSSCCFRCVALRGACVRDTPLLRSRC